jgi:hyperosmotically inducible protein
MFRMPLRCALVMLALAALPAAPLRAQAPDPLLLAVRDAIRSNPDFGIFDDVTVELEASVAVLTGRVTTAAKRTGLEKCAARVPGITSVRNGILVLPSSPEDDVLRQRVARSVYGHPAFWRHASRHNPPIHIIVEDGHVTLTGEVESEAEAALARSLAGGAGARSLSSRLGVRGSR